MRFSAFRRFISDEIIFERTPIQNSEIYINRRNTADKFQRYDIHDINNLDPDCLFAPFKAI